MPARHSPAVKCSINDVLIAVRNHPGLPPVEIRKVCGGPNSGSIYNACTMLVRRGYARYHEGRYFPTNKPGAYVPPNIRIPPVQDLVLAEPAASPVPTTPLAPLTPDAPLRDIDGDNLRLALLRFNQLLRCPLDLKDRLAIRLMVTIATGAVDAHVRLAGTPGGLHNVERYEDDHVVDPDGVETEKAIATQDRAAARAVKRQTRDQARRLGAARSG